MTTSIPEALSDRIIARIGRATMTALDELELAVGYLDAAGLVELADPLRVAAGNAARFRKAHPYLVEPPRRVDTPEALEISLEE